MSLRNNDIAAIDDVVTEENTENPPQTEESSSVETSSAESSSIESSSTESNSTESSSTESSSAETPSVPVLKDFNDGKKANIYESENGKLSQSILDTLQITDVSEETIEYYDGWSPDKTSYYDKNGNKVKGQAIIGGSLYNFDGDGNVIKNVVKGIDVSKYQPNIDWNAVKASGVDYVIIRAGYRGYGSGVLVEDPYFKRHIAGAKSAGLKVGLYVYSQAITVEEAVEEASMAVQLAKGYSLEYPIYFDTEATGTGVGRADGLSKSHRTTIARAFCETVRNSGYKAGVYASKSWFYYQLEYGQISHYDIWLAHYTTSTDFKHRYDMWQYTGRGSCPGIPNAVDLNWAYKVY